MGAGAGGERSKERDEGGVVSDEVYCSVLTCHISFMLHGNNNNNNHHHI